MRITRDTRQTHSFALDDHNLRRLCQSIQEHIGAFQLHADCADGLQRSFTSLEELIAYENTRGSRIQNLVFRANSADLHSWATLEFGSAADRNVRIHLETEQTPAEALNADINERLEAVRPWYHYLATASPMQVLIRYANLVLFIGVAMVGLQFATGPGRPPNWGGLTRGLGLGAALGLVIGLGAIALDEVRNRLFPNGAFLIGQGIKRHSDAEIIRVAVGIGFLVSLATGILVALF